LFLYDRLLYDILISELRFTRETLKNPMNRRTVIFSLSMAPLALAGATAAAERKKFIGTWKLVSGVSKDEVTGEVRYPWGRKPVGRLSYEESGRMFAQLMSPSRRPVGGLSSRGAAAAIASASADDMREMLTGFNAYFGTFDVDESSRTVIHHLQSALIPSWVGTDQRRHYEFAGPDELIILNTASQAAYRLVWHRE
jgi:Lipocalin-like domain